MNPTAFEYGATFIENASAAERIESEADCEVQDDYCTGTADWLVEASGFKSTAAVVSCDTCATTIWLHPKDNNLDLWAVSRDAIEEYEDVIDRFVPLEEYLESRRRLERRKKHYPDEPITLVETNDN